MKFLLASLLLLGGCAAGKATLTATGRVEPGDGHCACVKYPADYPPSERFAEDFYLDCYIDSDSDGFITFHERWLQQHIPKGFQCP